MKFLIYLLVILTPVLCASQFQIDSIITTDATCSDATDGTLTIYTSGGTNPITYDIGMGSQTNNEFTGLSCGSYTVIAYDATMTTVTSVGTVNCPSPLIVTSFYTDISCFGYCDGSYGVVVSGGVPPYSAVVSSGEVDPMFTSTSVFVNSCAGAYDIIVTDQNGCTVSESIIISDPPPLGVVTSNVLETSFGVCDGMVIASASGGNGIYSYEWFDNSMNSISQYNDTATGLCSGNYYVVVTDQNGCQSQPITCPLPPYSCSILSSSFEIPPMCFGSCDGILELNTTGGTAPYLVTGPYGSVTSYSSFVSLFGYCAGTYTFLIEDVNGCTEAVVANFFEPDPLVTVVAVTDETSAGACDGTIIATSSGGTAPYMYNFEDCNSGAPVTTPGAVCPGEYNVMITDANSCSSTSSCEVVGAFCDLTSSYTFNDTYCNGTCNGDVTIVTTGGATPYIVYDDMGGVTTYTSSVSFSNLCAGAYTFLVEDNGGCSETIVIIINEPPVMSLIVNTTDETSAGACDGTATAVVTGGFSPYTFLGMNCNNQNATTTPVMSSLCPDDYYFIVTDANGCEITSSCETVGTMSCNLVATYQMLQDPCEGQCNGVAEVVVSGGTAPYTITDPNGGPDETFSINWIFTNLCGGTHVVTITDANGCSFNSTLSVWELPPLDVVVTTTDEITGGACDGTAASTVWGGASFGYTYDWYNCASNQSAGIADSVGGLCPGDYGVVVMDAYGCMGSSFCETVNPGPSCNTVSTVQVTEPVCYGTCDGSVLINTTGGTLPYTVNDPMTGSVVTYSSAQVLGGICPGSYTLVVEDAVGCAETFNVLITEPTEVIHSVVIVDESAVGACDGSVTVTGTGGTPGYMYSINCSGSFQASPVFNGLCNGAYGVTVEDAAGCLSYCDSIDTVGTLNSVGVIVNEFEDFSVYPNPANQEVTLEFQGKLKQVNVYSVTGKRVYSSMEIYNNRIDISDWAKGVYMFILETESGRSVKRLIVE